MQTASTVQILDANNQNVSPATCIDSVYYEYSDTGSNVYRMSLRNRMIIAGSNLTDMNSLNYPTVEGNGKNTKIKWPQYYYKMDNAGSNGYIYTLNSAIEDFGSPLVQFINNYYEDEWAIVNSLNKNYLRTDGGNVMYRDLQIRNQNDASLNSTDSGYIKISSSTGCMIQMVDKRGAGSAADYKNFDVSLTAAHNSAYKYDVKIVAQNGNICVSTGAIDVSCTSSYKLTTGATGVINEQASRLILTTNTAANAFDSASQYKILVGDVSKGSVSFNQNTSTMMVESLVTDGVVKILGAKSVDIQKGDSQTIRMFDIPLNNPSTASETYDGNHHYTLKYYPSGNSLTQNPKTMKFVKEPNLYVYGDNETPIISFNATQDGNNSEETNNGVTDVSMYSQIVNVAIEGGTYAKYPTILSQNDVSKRNIYSTVLKSGNVAAPIIKKQENGTAPDAFIYLSQINGKPIISTTQAGVQNFQFATQEYVQSGWSVEFVAGTGGQKYELVAANSTQRNGLSSSTGEKKFTYSSVQLDGAGSLYAGTVYQTSDERLKDDIEYVSIESFNLPEIRQFKMKDESDGRIHYGYVAQELEKTHPELVYTEPGIGGLKRVDYTSATCLTIAHMQKKMDSMQQEIDELKQVVNKLLGKSQP